jgi:hypothetical protein
MKTFADKGGSDSGRMLASAAAFALMLGLFIALVRDFSAAEPDMVPASSVLSHK